MLDLARLRFSDFRGVQVATYPAGATFGPRRLFDYEFVWIIDGEVVWEVDGQTVPAPAGTLLLGRPGMRDAFTWDPARTTRHGFVHFNLHAPRGALPSAATWPLARTLPDGDVLRPLLHHLGWLIDTRPPGHEVLTQHAFAHLLGAFITGAIGTADGDGGAFHPLIDRVVAAIRERWRERLEPLSLPLLAKLAGMSRGHLVRVFKQELNLTPMAVVRLLRLERAATLLARTNLPVQEVAALTGFDNAFHFSRVFRTAYGQPPREFRSHLAAGGTVERHLPMARSQRLAARIWH